MPGEDLIIEEVLIDPERLRARVSELGAELSRDYAGRAPVMICVLKGAVFFLADLIRHVDVPCEIDFMAVSSYQGGTSSSGEVRLIKDLDASIEGRDVIIVEDIVDSGLTLSYLVELLSARKPASLEICTLLDKVEARQTSIDARYVGFEIPNRFVVGYGLDYAERFRNLDCIAIVDVDRLPGETPTRIRMPDGELIGAPATTPGVSQ